MATKYMVIVPPDPDSIVVAKRTLSEAVIYDSPPDIPGAVILRYEVPDMLRPEPIMYWQPPAGGSKVPVTVTPVTDGYSGYIPDTDGAEIDLTVEYQDQGETEGEIVSFVRIVHRFSPPRADGLVGRQFLYVGNGETVTTAADLKKFDTMGNAYPVVAADVTAFNDLQAEKAARLALANLGGLVPFDTLWNDCYDYDPVLGNAYAIPNNHSEVLPWTLRKINQAGATIWEVPFHGGQLAEVGSPRSITIDRYGVSFISHSSGRVIKVDDTGNVVWAQVLFLDDQYESWPEQSFMELSALTDFYGNFYGVPQW